MRSVPSPHLRTQHGTVPEVADAHGEGSKTCLGQCDFEGAERDSTEDSQVLRSQQQFVKDDKGANTDSFGTLGI
ncbi:hypothetical protein L596_011171 [Steinernema carpocapsae]|uniref:Uncharacterized protein n=1 Tax=Steinernema carpocapsae TaxID=34508 RepID=A0A4U5NU04_STECR|nr:hypothetical protein L596_011171 [Steinernema carpocapsae]